MNIVNKLIKEEILVKNAFDGTYAFTEMFLEIFKQEVEETVSILSYIPSYSIKAKSITIPCLEGLVLKTDGNGKITNAEESLKVKAITSQMKEINLNIPLGNTAIDLQGDELKTYIAKTLANLYINALYVRLVNELKALGRHEQGSCTQKWVTEFMKANLKGDALVIMSDNMPLKIADFDITNGEYTVFGKKCIFVPNEILTNIIIIIDKKSIEFYQAGNKESYIDEVSGSRKNVTYFGIIDYCNFLIKNPSKCYSCTME